MSAHLVPHELDRPADGYVFLQVLRTLASWSMVATLRDKSPMRERAFVLVLILSARVLYACMRRIEVTP